MLFSAGLVPTFYLIVRVLNWRNNLLALIIPAIGSPFFIILLRTYFKQVPNEVIESVKIDGGGQFRIFFTMILPLSMPALATCAVLISLNYWNDWFSAFLFITDPNLRPLQALMTQIAQDAELMRQQAFRGGVMAARDLVPDAVIMATCVVATLPMLIVFMFLQRFIVKGMTVGAVKG